MAGVTYPDLQQLVAKERDEKDDSPFSYLNSPIRKLLNKFSTS